MTVRVAVVGAGSQGVVHAEAYRDVEGVELVAVADADRELAGRVAQALDVPGYGSAEELFASESVDLVSVCTPPAWHRIVVDAAVEAGVRGVHCEKPTARTYADALAMRRRTAEAGIPLTFNLQRRFEPVHQFAARQLADGAIGRIERVTAHAPNLFDWGTHIVDLMLFYLGDIDPLWVDGQVDLAYPRFVYGIPAETSSVSDIAWDGIAGILRTGRAVDAEMPDILAQTGIVVDGTDGRLTAVNGVCSIRRFDGEAREERTPWSTDTSTWRLGVDPAIEHCTRAALTDVVRSLESGRESLLDARHALAGAGIIFGTYASSVERARIGLPLGEIGNPLIEGLDDGLWRPAGEPLRSTY